MDISFKKLPPCAEALSLHIKRSAYISGLLWNNSTSREADYPSPAQWGWSLDDNNKYIRIWIENKIPTQLIRKIKLSCGCFKKKCKNCVCKQANVACLNSCKCRKECQISI